MSINIHQIVIMILIRAETRNTAGTMSIEEVQWLYASFEQINDILNTPKEKAERELFMATQLQGSIGLHYFEDYDGNQDVDKQYQAFKSQVDAMLLQLQLQSAYILRELESALQKIKEEQVAIIG